MRLAMLKVTVMVVVVVVLLFLLIVFVAAAAAQGRVKRQSWSFACEHVVRDGVQNDGGAVVEHRLALEEHRQHRRRAQLLQERDDGDGVRGAEDRGDREAEEDGPTSTKGKRVQRKGLSNVGQNEVRRVGLGRSTIKRESSTVKLLVLYDLYSFWDPPTTLLSGGPVTLVSSSLTV